MSIIDNSPVSKAGYITQDGGVADKNFTIDWDNYKNCIIVTNTDGTKKISTRIFEVIELNQQ